MCQHLKGLYNSDNQYFPSEFCVTFEKYSWVKKKKIHSMFKIAKQTLALQRTKSSLVVSDSTMY